MMEDQEPAAMVVAVEFVATEEEVHAALMSLAERGQLNFLDPEVIEEVVKPLLKLGIDPRSETVLTVLLFACRAISNKLDRLLGEAPGKDLMAALCQSVARHFVGEACDWLMHGVVKASALDELPSAI